MYNLVVCAIFKNESHILEEWIIHYLSRGFEHIYLVNDFSTDDYLPIIDKFGSYVTLFQNDIVTKTVGKQITIYEKYFRPILINTRWAAILDLDEFLYSPTNHKITDIINACRNCAEIKVDWLHFGSNGHIAQPSSVIEGFTKRAAFDRQKEYYGHKSFFRPDKLIRFDIHFHYVDGVSKHFNYSDDASVMMVINHYNIQSRDFFLNVKCTRGDINNWFDHIKKTRDIQLFNKYDVNEIEDRRLLDQNIQFNINPK